MAFLLLFYEITKSDQGNGSFSLKLFAKRYWDIVLLEDAALPA